MFILVIGLWLEGSRGGRSLEGFHPFGGGCEVHVFKVRLRVCMKGFENWVWSLPGLWKAVPPFR